MENFKIFIKEEINRLLQFIEYEFMKNQGALTFNREKLKITTRELLEKLQICKMSFIQEYICELEEYYYNIFDSKIDMRPYMDKYFQKLLDFSISYFSEKYFKEPPVNDSLEKVISFLNQRLNQSCILHYIQRKVKRINSKIYCKDTEAVTE